MKKNKSNIEKDTFLAQWMAGELSDEALQELVSEKDYQLYVKIRTHFEHVASPSSDIDKTYQKLTSKLTPKQETIVKKMIPNWVYSAVAVLVVLFGIFRFYRAETIQTTDFTQTKELVLNDGTQVFLNAKSSLQYAKYQFQREVNLQGEAFFEVTKKGDFTITTPLGKVQVLGTKFNVRATKTIFEVICYEGKVRVTYQGSKKVLHPSDAWRVHKGSAPISWKTTESTASWIRGESVFKSMPASYVLESLEKQYHIHITTKVPVDTIRFTGSFPNDNLQHALQSICLPLQLDYKIKQDNEVILLEK